jgi:hypothetical protein
MAVKAGRFLVPPERFLLPRRGVSLSMSDERRIREFKLDLDRDTAHGRYANVAVIAHTKDEFIIDFALAYPGQAPLVGSRVITSPQHAKAFLRSLEDNVRKYEQRFGLIPEPARRVSEAEQN